MNIRDFRDKLRLSQRQFAEYFAIPLGTLRNWEQGISAPPDYVYDMIFRIIGRDKMINIETIKFVKMLDELASLSKNGIEPFENATYDTFHSKIYYDSEMVDGEDGFQVVQEACIDDCLHHDIVCYYDSSSLEYTVRVRIDEESTYIEVTLIISGDIVVIENGTWYFA